MKVLYWIGGLALAGGLGYALLKKDGGENGETQTEKIKAEDIWKASSYKSEFERSRDPVKIPPYHAEHGDGNNPRIHVTQSQFEDNFKAYTRLLVDTPEWQESVIKRTKETGWPESGKGALEAMYIHLRNYTAGKYYY